MDVCLENGGVEKGRVGWQIICQEGNQATETIRACALKKDLLLRCYNCEQVAER